MIKLLFMGLWGGLVALGANYGTDVWLANRNARPTVAEAAVALEQRKTATINVPVVKDGSVQGYVIVQLSYTVDKVGVKTLPFSPEAYLIDETFRAIYTDDSLDFRQLARYDVKRLTAFLLERMRTRTGLDVVKEVLIQEFNFVSKSDLRN